MLVESDGAGRLRAIAERGLANEEAAFLLPKLTPEGSLPEIGQQELVEDAANLDPEQRVFVARVEMVGDGDDADAVVLEVVEEQKHQSVVTGQPGQVVDQDDVERALLRSFAQSDEARPGGNRPGLGVIGVDLVLEDDEAPLLGRDAAGQDLVLDAFAPLILAAIAGVDGSTQGSRHRSVLLGRRIRGKTARRERGPDEIDVLTGEVDRNMIDQLGEVGSPAGLRVRQEDGIGATGRHRKTSPAAREAPAREHLDGSSARRATLPSGWRDGDSRAAVRSSSWSQQPWSLRGCSRRGPHHAASGALSFRSPGSPGSSHRRGNRRQRANPTRRQDQPAQYTSHGWSRLPEMQGVSMDFYGLGWTPAHVVGMGRTHTDNRSR